MLVSDVIGALGGMLLAVGLVPQVWKMFTTRSAKDISYLWMGTYFAGLSLTLVYLVMVSAIVGAVAAGAELVFVCVIIAALDCGMYGSEEAVDAENNDVECAMVSTRSSSSASSQDAFKVLAPHKAVSQHALKKSAPHKKVDQWKIPMGM